MKIIDIVFAMVQNSAPTTIVSEGDCGSNKASELALFFKVLPYFRRFDKVKLFFLHYFLIREWYTANDIDT